MTFHPSSFQYIIHFGKYNGYSFGYIAEKDPAYLKWLAEADNMAQNIKDAASKTLSGMPLDGLHLTAAAPKEQNNTPVRMWSVGKEMVAVSFPYDVELRERFKLTIDGRVWNAKEMRWEFPAVHLPRAIDFFGGKEKVLADAEVKKLYTKELDRRKKLDEIRQKTDTNIEIPTKLPLYDFQKVAVEFIEAAGGRAVDADQMGLGKTATAIGYSEKNKLKTLIVCPKSVKINWKREIKKFANKDACVWEPTGRTGSKNAQYHIVNYDIVARFADDFRAMNFDLLVCDEATYLKNYRSIRAKTVLGYWKERRKFPGLKIPKVIFLTGTPILNRPMEAFTLLSYLDKKRFNNPRHFMDRYGIDKETTKNLDELHDRTKDLVIRRLKSQVAKELPLKQRNDLYVEMTKEEYKEYNKEIDELFKLWNSNGRPSAAQMPAIRNFLFELKWERIIEFTDQILDSGRNLLIFTIQQEHAYRLAKHYGKGARVITGNETGNIRQKAIDDLSENRARVGVFTINAGGMGIDGLQHTISDVLFIDRWWVPAIHEQAEDRVHRKGQKNPVTIWYVTVEDTIDEVMQEVLTEKQAIIDQVVDGQLIDGVRNKSIFKEVVKKMALARKMQFDEDKIVDEV